MEDGERNVRTEQHCHGYVLRDYRDYLDRDVEMGRRFTAALAERGVRVTLRGTWYISAAHTEADIEETLDRAEAALDSL